MTEKKSKKTILDWIIAIVAGIYLLNLTFGFDLIPDNIPVFGNLDEFVASWLVLRNVL